MLLKRIAVSARTENLCQASCMRLLQTGRCTGLAQEITALVPMRDDFFGHPRPVETICGEYGAMVVAKKAFGMLQTPGVQNNWAGDILSVFPQNSKGVISLQVSWPPSVRTPHMFWVSVEPAWIRVHDYFATPPRADIAAIQQCGQAIESVFCAYLSVSLDKGQALLKEHVKQKNVGQPHPYDMITAYVLKKGDLRGAAL